MSLLLPKVQSVDLCRDHLPKMEMLCPECGWASHAGVGTCQEWLYFSHGQSTADVVIEICRVIWCRTEDPAQFSKEGCFFGAAMDDRLQEQRVLP